MKNLKRILLLIVVLTTLCSCSNNGENVINTTDNNVDSQVETDNNAEKVYSIGTLQLVQHSALDNANQGFFDYLNDMNVKYNNDYQNASGDQSACLSIAQKFVNNNYDLIYAIATPAAQAVISVDENIPIIASAVTDPAASGLCDTNDKPNGLLTAASDLTPVDAQFSLLQELFPEAKNIGILYCSAEANSKIQSDLAEAAASKRGLNTKVYTVVSSTDIQTIVETMVNEVDCIYIPTDNTISSSINTVTTITNENKIPTIVGEEAMVDGGGTATYGIDYYQLGRVAGELAYDVLVNGKNPGDLSVRYLKESDCKRKINPLASELFGININ